MGNYQTTIDAIAGISEGSDFMFKIKKGFTLIEVILSIALLGILAVAFLPSMSNYIRWIVNTKTDITQKAFETQDAMETAIQEVIKAMNKGTGAIDPAEYTSLNITEKTEVKLFKDKFSKYASRQYPSAYKVEVAEGNKKFTTLVGDKRLPELPVPVINTVSRTFVKNGVERPGNHEYFNYTNLKILAKSNMSENPQNSFNRYRNDWYVSKPGFIIPIQDIDKIDEDNDLGRIYPAFPDDYVAVPIYSELGSAYTYVSATQRNISAELKNDIVSKYPGRHILYTITPFAKSLKKGITSSLLPLYVYGPDVTANLMLHLDASTINMSDIYNSSTNSNGTILFEDEENYIRSWKNSRASVETENTNPYKATQASKASMPVLVKDTVFLKPEIPFQTEAVDGEMIYSVWGRALGNEPDASSYSNMTITGINTAVNNNWSMFLVMRKIKSPLAPASGPIIKNNSGGEWSLGWEVAADDYQLKLISDPTDPTSEVALSDVPDDWLLVHAKSTESGTYLKAASLEKGGVYNQYASGTGTIDINDINMTFNGVEIAEILLYNANESSEDIGKIETYLTNKYNPD